MPRSFSQRGALLRWFRQNQRDLPWRHTKDPYAIWLSEVMLQQTQVSTVVPYYQRFLERFPTVKSLARAKPAQVFAAWSGLGYYSRARNLHRAAKVVAQTHKGRLPKSAAELWALPGFGRYTAGAVASMAFGQPAPVVDGNVARVLSRAFGVEGAPGDRGREERLWQQASELLWVKDPGEWNQALMELGALVCRPAEPRCDKCPWRRHCLAFRHGRTAELPKVRPRAQKKPLRLDAAVCTRRGRVLLARRREGGLFGGLWELPALATFGGRGGLSGQARPLGAVRRTLTHRELTIALFWVPPPRRVGKAAPYEEFRWVTRRESEALGMSSAMAEALKKSRIF